MERRQMRQALNVAEKPSVAKSVTFILSHGSSSRMISRSEFNPVFQFDYSSSDQDYHMIFTSVRGHLMNFDFGQEHKIWELPKIQDLYDAEIYHNLSPDCHKMEDNLQYLARQVDTLILWLDCDREGENIAFEVVDIVRRINPQIRILRAHFSALTERDINNAMETLTPPNQNLSDAVEIRQKIDLLIGASFTRMQTLSFRVVFYYNIDAQGNQGNNNNKTDAKHVISYGPCQFPTLNFIVERAEKIRNFRPEEFYYIELKVEKEENGQKHEVKFNWKRNRLFDKIITLTIYEKVFDTKTCKVINIAQNPKTRLRPIPLNTVEMTKLISRKLRINSHEAMDIAEKLYQKGLISYPRTETQKYGKNELSGLKRALEDQTKSHIWGDYAKRLLDNDQRYTLPRYGRLDDGAHPPIHPVKFGYSDDLNDKEKRIYELITRHFLASISPDAKGKETIIDIEMGGEYFNSKGLIVDDLGYLEVFIYEKWTDSYLPIFTNGEVITPKSLLMETGKTTPPNFLTEAELIGLMDKQGIGTDATIHEHIKHIQVRGYARQFGSIFKPTLIGTALRHSYKAIGIEIYKPYLRAAMEREMKEVCEGKKQKNAVYNEMKREMKVIFDKVFILLPRMKEFLQKFLNDNQDYDSQLNINNNWRRNNDEDGNNGNGDGNDDGDDSYHNRRGNGRGGRRGGGRGGGENGYQGGQRGRGRGRGRGRAKSNNNDNDDNHNNKGDDYTKRSNYNNSNGNYKSYSTDHSASSSFTNANSNSNDYNSNEREVPNKRTYKYNNNPSYNSNHNNNSNNNNSNSLSSNNSIRDCPKCTNPLKLLMNRAKNTYFLGCTDYPNCKETMNINNPITCSISTQKCNKCSINGNTIFLHQVSFTDNGELEHRCLGNCLFETKSYNNNSKQNYKGGYNSNNNNQYKRKNNNNYGQYNNNNYKKKNNYNRNNAENIDDGFYDNDININFAIDDY